MGPPTVGAALSAINNAFKAVTEMLSPSEGDERRSAVQDIEHEAAVQHDELRRRLAADGNGAAADALRVQAAGFEEACDFKEVRLSSCRSGSVPFCRLDGRVRIVNHLKCTEGPKSKRVPGSRVVQSFRRENTSKKRKGILQLSARHRAQDICDGDEWSTEL